MKIAVASDLHLEFGGLELRNDQNADVLILSGDIMVSEDVARHPIDRGPYAPVDSHRYINALRYKEFFDMVNSEFPLVLYVAGNHEFYGGRWVKSLTVIREWLEQFPNVFFLENDVHRHQDVTFIGCTLWTDMNNHDPLTMHSVRDMMNDYRDITNDEKGYTKLRPVHTMERHAKSKNYIRTIVAEKHDEKFVVIGHHAPTFQSIPHEYRSQTLMNGAYASDLSEFILDHPQIKLWTHGHTHDPWDYKVGDTRVVCNPRGYKGYETRANTFALQYVEV